jgi:hypothetical protein
MENPKRAVPWGRVAGLASGLVCATALIIFGIPGAALAQKKATGGGGSGGGGSTSPNIAVTSTLNDSNSTNNYEIQSDGFGAYTNGTDSVSSILQEDKCGSGCGDWVLDTRQSKTRSVSVTLVADPNGQSFPNAPPPPNFSQADVPTRIIVKCSQTVTGSFLAIQPGANIPCLMSTRFDYAHAHYRLSMNSNAGTAIPETNDALITCTSTSGTCSSWTVTTTGTNGYNVARLEQNTKGSTWVSIGDYDVNFSFTVTNP